MTGFDAFISMMFCVQVDSAITEVLYGALTTRNVAPALGTVSKLTVPSPNEPVIFSVQAVEFSPVRHLAVARERAVARVDRDLEVVLPHVVELADRAARLLDRELRGLLLVTRHVSRGDRGTTRAASAAPSDDELLFFMEFALGCFGGTGRKGLPSDSRPLLVGDM